VYDFDTLKKKASNAFYLLSNEFVVNEYSDFLLKSNSLGYYFIYMSENQVILI